MRKAVSPRGARELRNGGQYRLTHLSTYSALSLRGSGKFGSDSIGTMAGSHSILDLWKRVKKESTSTKTRFS